MNPATVSAGPAGKYASASRTRPFRPAPCEGIGIVRQLAGLTM